MSEIWTEKELAILRRTYPNKSTTAIAKRLGRSLSATYQRALKIGLRKDKGFIAKQAVKVLRKAGLAYRFKPGHKTWNAGKKGWHAGGRSGETQFKKGSVPKTYRPVGSERTNREGDTEIKVADPDVWKTRKQVIWEKKNGPVPSAMVLRWVNGMPKLMTRSQNMQMNSVHRYPPDIKFAMRVAKRLIREISKYEQY